MTQEAQLLNQHPEIRQAAESSEEFRSWKNNLPSVDLDGETLYIRGGDMLKDADQVLVEWARMKGLLQSQD